MSGKTPLFPFLFLTLVTSQALACGGCKEHQSASGQDNGNTVTMDDSASKRGFADRKPASEGRSVFRMKKDGTVEVTRETPAEASRRAQLEVQKRY